MTNRDQGDEANKGGEEAKFSSDFSKAPAEAGNDAGVLRPVNIRELGELRTATRTGGTAEARVCFVDKDGQHIEVNGSVKEGSKPAGSWEYSYLERPGGKLETAGCTVAVGDKVEKWERHFDQQGRLNAETDRVGNQMRREVLFDRDQQGRVVKARESVYDENGVKIEEHVYEVGAERTRGTGTSVYFDESGKEKMRDVRKLEGIRPYNAGGPIGPTEPIDLESVGGVYQSTLKLQTDTPRNKIFEKV